MSQKLAKLLQDQIISRELFSDHSEFRKFTALKCNKELRRVDSSQKDAVDVNQIMKRFEKTGQIVAQSKVVFFGDFTNTPDNYLEAMKLIDSAHEAFMDLPSKVRDRFQNQPEKFMEFVQDPKNKKELAQMGLLKKLVPNALELSARELAKAADALHKSTENKKKSDA